MSDKKGSFDNVIKYAWVVVIIIFVLMVAKYLVPQLWDWLIELFRIWRK